MVTLYLMRFAGVFMAKFVPHFVQGISGNSFPSPFSNPPGRGLPSLNLNVIKDLMLKMKLSTVC